MVLLAIKVGLEQLRPALQEVSPLLSVPRSKPVRYAKWGFVPEHAPTFEFR